jgi:hypothetical protein
MKNLWNDKEVVRALDIFNEVHPGWVKKPNVTRCPECTKKYPRRRFGLNYCMTHHFANENWLTGKKGAAMCSLVALGDNLLKKRLETDGL